MAKLTADVLITRLANRLGHDSADSTVRADVLKQINTSQRDICQDHSLRFLVTSSTLSVVSSSVSVPATIDDSKTMALGRSDGSKIEYVSADEWFRVRLDTYLEPATPTEPTHYTVADVGGTQKFLFKPASITSTVSYLAQKIVTDMTDSSGSSSVLPEGWEDTLLLDHAEAELRRAMGEPFWKEIADRAQQKKERLYSSYRTTKEQPMTDREQVERKNASQLAPEKP